MARPSWDSVWMNFAKTIAKRSHDNRLHVGSVVVTSDNTQVLSLGYNGNYSGGPNASESDEPGESGLIHSEVNSILKLDYNNPKRKIMYVTHSPCRMCSKLIIGAGIREVIYDKDYRDVSGLDILRDAGIIVRKFNTRRE